MANKPPDFCPYCGSRLTEIDPPTIHLCEDCGQYVFHNPTPTARVAVLDGGSILLNEINVGGLYGVWEVPGGAIEIGEQPREAVARELQEETGLYADLDALVLFDVVAYEKFDNHHKLVLLYAIDKSATGGELSVGAEPRDVQYWDPIEFAAEGHELTDRYPDKYEDLHAWIEAAEIAAHPERKS